MLEMPCFHGLQAALSIGSLSCPLSSDALWPLLDAGVPEHQRTINARRGPYLLGDKAGEESY